MIVTTDFSNNYDHDPIRHFHFDEFSHLDNNFTLKYGLGMPRSKPDAGGMIYLDFEIPILGLSHHIVNYEKFCDKVVILCPYTAEWLNKRNNYNKIIDSFFPINKKYVPEKQDKIYDVCYCGQANSQELINLIATVSRFKYCHISYNEDKVTHQSCTFQEKLNLIGQSKYA
jgi:hypothetical protein